jgi:hypothetical protein
MAAPIISIEHLNSYWREKAGLPPGPQGSPSYFDLTLGGNPSYVALGWLNGWCLDPNLELLGNNTRYPAGAVYSSYEQNLLPAGLFGAPIPGADPAGNLDLVNWVINQNFQSNPQFNYGEVQAAIWKLLGYGEITTGIDLVADGPVLSSDIQIIYNAALTHDGFVPDIGQNVAVILDLGRDKQPIIVEMPAAKLGNFVWHDLNANGAQDLGEAGIAGATVRLMRDINGDGDFDDANEILANTTTDSTGHYEFKGLTPGLDYQVHFSTPGGYDGASPRHAAAVPAALDSDGADSDIVVLAPGEFNSTIDSGFYKSAKLGDFVWYDTNADGAQDAGEVGIGGATVRLVRDLNSDGKFDAPGEVVATTTTDGSGFYEFADLTPGIGYQVQFSTPTGFDGASARQAIGVPPALDSDGALSDTVVLASGEFNSTIDAGFYKFAKLGDFVWHDLNANGAQDGGEAGITGATVELVRDLTADGKFDAPGEILAATTTDSSGFYEFSGLTPGDPYQVRFSMPAGFDATSPRQATGVGAALNSDGAVSDVVTLTAGEFNSTIDSGFYKYASLGDFVWLDKNANGVQDTGEQGISGVTVKLLADTDHDGAIDDLVATQITDSNGLYKFSGLTPATQYQVEFTNPDTVGPDAYVFSPRHSTLDITKDSDGAVSDAVVLSSGEFNPTVDAGLYRKGSIHVFGFLDKDGDGVLDTTEGAFPSNPGKTIQLIDAQGQVIDTRVTNANGEAWFEGLTPGTYTVKENPLPGGYALTTASAVTVVVGSGEEHVYKAGAAYLPAGDQRVEVLDTSLMFGNAPVGIDVEKLVRGRYEVDDCKGGEGLTPGFWKTHSTYGPAPLSGWPQTGYSPNASYESIFGVSVPGTPSLYDALGAGGGGLNALLRHSAAALLNASNPYVDYAYTKAQVILMTKAAIATGNYEIVKNLFATQNELGADLTTLAHSGSIVETADYDADTPTGPEIPVGGDAIFTYIVKNTGAIELSDVKVTDDRISTLTFIGGDTDGDGKLDPNEVWKYTATEDVTTTGQHVNIATATGQVAGLTVTDSDAAYYTTAAGKAKIGDRVWCDKDMDGVQDAGESGIAGVTVKLKDEGGTVLQTTKTDASGLYSFDVAAGTYSVFFDRPTGYAFTGQDKGGNDALDSDAFSSGGTATLTVAGGEQKLTIDAGLVVSGPKFYVVDSYCDSVFKYNEDGGGTGNFDLRSANTGPTGIAANLDGSKLWVLDSNKNVYIHNANGTSAGQWKAADLGTAPEGIAVSGQDVWIVDSASDKIYWYDNGATWTSGTHTATKTFALNSAITNAKGIATDGDRLWLVNDGTTDKVYVYDVGGAVETNPTLSLLGSWTLASGNAKPTGLTIDPTNSSTSIWVVDNGTDKVYEYANARSVTSGSGPTPTTFNLAYGNSNAQDIADPLSFIGQVDAGISQEVFC